MEDIAHDQEVLLGELNVQIVQGFGWLIDWLVFNAIKDLVIACACTYFMYFQYSHFTLSYYVSVLDIEMIQAFWWLYAIAYSNLSYCNAMPQYLLHN